MTGLPRPARNTGLWRRSARFRADVPGSGLEGVRRVCKPGPIQGVGGAYGVGRGLGCGRIKVMLLDVCSLLFCSLGTVF